ncbi:hypothetical protein [Chitinophaga japonensis]|uniref:DUF4878 domain-containing protein n=1 Tax=Chitinophaga japonensis TaxID=104662 RepID=A0A562T5Y1_CHIJA|nr:hypothetical protein [Chitinophaga japonensis]TWI88951.1 hypothetical protein LX66_3042 [Chitinophaga japonensis]
MKYLNTLLVTTILVLATKMACGQTTVNETITETFFKAYEKNPTGAYEDLFISNKWMKDNKTQIQTIKIKFGDLLSSLGDYFGYELITEKKVGESYVLKSYLVKYERQPLRFTFVLYKPNKEWQIQNFSYDTNIQEELEEAAKAYRLNYNY